MRGGTNNYEQSYMTSSELLKFNTEKKNQRQAGNNASYTMNIKLFTYTAAITDILMLDDICISYNSYSRKPFEANGSQCFMWKVTAKSLKSLAWTRELKKMTFSPRVLANGEGACGGGGAQRKN